MSPAKNPRKKASRDNGSEHVILAELSALREASETGVLRASGGDGEQTSIFLMGGDIIACASPHDEARFAALLGRAAELDPAAMSAVQGAVKPGEDLADLLVASKKVTGPQVLEARAALFSENLSWALLSTPQAVEFEAQDAVFPGNMQLGQDSDALLSEAATWLSSVAALVEGLSSEQTWAAVGERPEDCSEATWKQLSSGQDITSLLQVLGPPLRDSSSKLAQWISAGAVADSAASPAKDTVDEDDYARAARGEFIKSYEVLDKVDLSGTDFVPQSQGAIEVEAGHDDGFVPDSLAAASGDFDVFIEAGDDEELLVTSDDDDGPAVLTLDDEVEAASESSEAIEPATGPFSQEQLNDFLDRIRVFNSIFRIIFSTFSTHITEARSIQRFNALIGSRQRQYPELFKGIKVDPDGAVPTDALIANLGACEPGDYASRLHQGLYELIFSHLYDAKDMLPGTAETDMMEQIVVYERRLHRM